jgi:hypothetical protein
VVVVVIELAIAADAGAARGDDVLTASKSYGGAEASME